MIRDLKISTKIVIATVVLFLAFVSTWAVGQQGLAAAGTQAVELGEHRLPAVYGLQKMLSGLLHVAAGQRGLIHKRMMMDPELRKANYDEVAVGLHEITEGKKAYERLSQSPEETRIWNTLATHWDEWHRSVQAVVDLAREKDA